MKDKALPVVKCHADPKQWIVPAFTHCKFAPANDVGAVRRWHPSLVDYAFLQAACQARPLPISLFLQLLPLLLVSFRRLDCERLCGLVRECPYSATPPFQDHSSVFKL